MRLTQPLRALSVIALTAIVGLLAGCGGGGIPAWNPKKDRGPMGASGGTNDIDALNMVILQPGDPITITFTELAPGMQESRQRIGEDGNINLHLGVTIKAAGRTPTQVAQAIREAYVPKYYQYLTPTVKPDERFYYVGGEVRQPGRQPYTGPMTVIRAIDTGGGFTDYAKKSEIILTRGNGQKFRVNYKKAIKDPAYDPPVYPNDQVKVERRLW